MQSMKDLDDGRYNKVANIVGHTMQYHPHDLEISLLKSKAFWGIPKEFCKSSLYIGISKSFKFKSIISVSNEIDFAA